MTQRLPFVYFGPSPLGGRGVFTLQEIPKGALIEVCPVIVLSETDKSLIHKTHLHDYYFLWGKEERECVIALGFGSLYNHLYTPNAEYVIDEEQQCIDIYSIRDIKAGEEITLNYNGDPMDRTRVWFDKGVEGD
ncbi:MAG: SET domain-containing protein-lysine N-methyltransferase [Saprospiraceae bacterium]|nr:MAG: SET domain-containing protein-lysine N-methyltransferase [Saprospiraceae bacterium]